MPHELTKDYLDQRLTAFEKRQDKTDQRLEGMEARILGSIQDMNASFNKSQGLQNERMDRFENKLDAVAGRLEDVAEDVSKIKLAVLDLMGTDRHMHNLVRELKGKGIALDERKIFAS